MAQAPNRSMAQDRTSCLPSPVPATSLAPAEPALARILQIYVQCVRRFVQGLELPDAPPSQVMATRAPTLTPFTPQTTTAMAPVSPTTESPPAPPASSASQALVEAIKSRDQQRIEQVAKKLRRAASDQARTLRKPDLMPEVMRQRVNQACRVIDGLQWRLTTPLMAAAGADNARVLAQLLEVKADPNLCTPDNGAPLMHANCATIVQALLQAGARVDASDARMGTALIRAIQADLDPQAVQALLDAEADPNQMVFCQRLELMLEHVLVHRRARTTLAAAAPSRFNALMAAAFHGRTSHIGLLLAAGADLRLTGGPKGYTALMMAVAAREPDAVRALLAAGAQVDELADDGSSALYLAASKGDCAILRQLIEAGADVNRRDEDGMTVLARVQAEFEQRRGTLLAQGLQQVRALLLGAGALDSQSG